MTYLEALQLIQKASKFCSIKCECVQVNNHGSGDINNRGSFVVIFDDYITESYVDAFNWILEKE